MIRTGIVGVGKMGVSHIAIANAHKKLDLVAACDSQSLLLAGLRSQIDIQTFKDFNKMIDDAKLQAVFIATPTASHATLAKHAMERGVGVFVEKPLTLSATESRELADIAAANKVSNQVGYHNRFIGTFRETARMVAAGAIGEVHHVDGRAFGQVVTGNKGGGKTWRAKKSEGGGCLHDYACHVIDLMNLVAGAPSEVTGANLSKIHSTQVEDAVYALFKYPNGAIGTLETNWSDESYRKMTTSVTIYGTKGKIYADRQECRLYLKPGHKFESFDEGWTIRYITELQDPVEYYLRGEEYSSQVDAFANSFFDQSDQYACGFEHGAETDWVVDQIAQVHAHGPATAGGTTDRSEMEASVNNSDNTIINAVRNLAGKFSGKENS